MFLLRSAVLLFLLYSVSAGLFEGLSSSPSEFSQDSIDTVGDFISRPFESSDSDEPPEFKYDLSGGDLEILLDSPVYLAERVFRDLENFPAHLNPKHSGVRVTIQEPRLDDQVWLIHKGDGYGRDSDTVVVAARHMSHRWTVEKSRNFYGRKTVRQLRDKGGAVYELVTNNCHHASERMFNL